MSFGKGRASRRWMPETYRPVPKRKNVPRRRENGRLEKRGVFAGVNGRCGLYVFVRQVCLTTLLGKMPLD